MLSFSVILRSTLQGLPTATTPAGMSLATTLPAPMTVPSPDGDAGQNGHVAAQPDVIPQRDRLAQLQPAVALLRQHGVDGGVHAAVRADEAVLSKGNLGASIR